MSDWEFTCKCGAEALGPNTGMCADCWLKHVGPEQANYWTQEELDDAKVRADRLAKALGWGASMK